MLTLLFDGPEREHLLPLTYTRPVADLRIGIDTIHEKWEALLQTEAGILTLPYLQPAFPFPARERYRLINSSILPSAPLIQEINNLREGEVLRKDDTVIALIVEAQSIHTFDRANPAGTLHQVKTLPSTIEIDHITRPWHLITLNGKQLELDFDRITAHRTSAPIDASNKFIGDRFFAEEGAQAHYSIFNSSSGAIYLGSGSEVMEGCMIRGGLALGADSTVKMGAKLYGPSTFGPYCKVGGEITNSVIWGYTNKGHDGFMGNSIIGAWCNFGADTNTSNLKNNYKKVNMFSHAVGGQVATGMQFLGLLMGDHSKTGINTMLNTGTVVGTSTNVFGGGFPPVFIPSFTWSNAGKIETYLPDKALEVAEAVMQRRDITMTIVDREVLRHVFAETAKFRF